MRILMRRIDAQRFAEKLGGFDIVALAFHSIHTEALPLPEPGRLLLRELAARDRRTHGLEDLQLAFALRDIPDAIRLNRGPHFRPGTKPAHFQPVDLGTRAQSDVHTAAVL